MMATEFAPPDSSPGSAEPATTREELEPGAILGDRYEILQMLGRGGMGAVYKARDRELDRLVALKVIRQELANNPKVIDRFKQELILARQVTHKNVIRLFDLGVAGGLKFITMEFIEGRILSAETARKKPTPEESTRIIQQVCRALEAAHNEGVIHRDLKPQNIMVDEQGKASVMDFGLAFSASEVGGAKGADLAGTPAYMSPEQARQGEIDHRSDIFTLGIIYYELLTGQLPFQAKTVLESLKKRTEEPAKPAVEVDPRIPKAMSDVARKCMAVDPADRYQSAAELLRQLDVLTGDYKPVTRFWKWMTAAAGILLLLVVIGGVAFRDRLLKPPAQKQPVTVLVADFDNRTGDPVFSGTLEATLKLALEGASFISAYDRTKMRDLGLPAPAGALNEAAAQKIAVGQGLNVVVSGSLERSGSAYSLSLRAIQPVTGKTLATAGETASNKDRVLSAVTKLAVAVRKALGDATSESTQRLAMETLTAGTLNAVHEYAVALDALSSGRNDEAQAHFSNAVNLDANFGLAYAGMASASHNLGRQQDAEKYIRQAITHLDRMTERERYRTRAFLYLLLGDQRKCVEEYGTLLGRYTSDTGAYNNMAVCSTRLRNMPKALEEIRRAVAILPKRATYRVNLSFYSSYAGDFQTAAKEAAAAIQLNPAYPSGLQAQAFASLGQDRLAEAAEAYQKLEKISVSDGAAGLADLALYEGRFGDAVRILRKSAAADKAARMPDAAADKYALLAYAELLRGQKGPAIEAANAALAISKAVKTRFLAARVFIAGGEAAQARQLADGLGLELQIEPQAYAKLLEGEAALQAKDGRRAVKLFTEANGLLDTWIGRFDLGRAYLEIEAFLEADSEFDRCLKRRGETMALFLDEVPTYGYFPPVYYYQGRAREGLKTEGFAESYRKYLGIRGKAGEDLLLPEARRRAEGRKAPAETPSHP